MIAVRKTLEGVIFDAYVQPRSSVNAIVGVHDQALKIKLTSAPVGGAANKQCIQVLAKLLGLPKSALAITSGHSSRRKKIRIMVSSASKNQKKVEEIISQLIILAQKSTTKTP